MPSKCLLWDGFKRDLDSDIEVQDSRAALANHLGIVPGGPVSILNVAL